METQVTLSLPEKLYERAEHLARLRQQDITTVIEDLLDDTLPSIEGDNEISTVSQPDDALDREMQAYIRLHPALKEKYFGKYVAVYGGELIDHDEDFEALYERVRSQYPHDIVWMSPVKEEPIETIYIRSPRFVQEDP
jgi:hypothetical protein